MARVGLRRLVYPLLTVVPLLGGFTGRDRSATLGGPLRIAADHSSVVIHPTPVSVGLTSGKPAPERMTPGELDSTIGPVSISIPPLLSCLDMV